MQPTIGRQVHYFSRTPAGSFNGPFAATVCYVHSVTRVNLQVIDHNGESSARTSVRMVQEDESTPQESYCRWPKRA